mmetsp:Transcript_29480/g.43703  ORF Transcript_29480/g.43703 Transcript_29480/m.43703 type:complete len:281 (-) Transcript_29480:91-933(-)
MLFLFRSLTISFFVLATSCWSFALPGGFPHKLSSVSKSIQVKVNPRPSLKVSPKTTALKTVAIDADTVDATLKITDDTFLSRIIRIGNHIPAFGSIAYFGLISMASMMGMSSVGDTPGTLTYALTKFVGSTTNSAFSAFFPSFITPPNFIFLIWPFISVVQLGTVAISALSPGKPVLSQDDLTSLSAANVAATGWLIVSSRASAEVLPLGSFLVLPLVPILSAFPLRRKDEDKVSGASASTALTLRNFVFQVYSSFTTIAAFLGTYICDSFPPCCFHCTL